MHYRRRHFPHPSQLLEEGQGAAALPCGNSKLQETAYQLSEGIVTSCHTSVQSRFRPHTSLPWLLSTPPTAAPTKSWRLGRPYARLTPSISPLLDAQATLQHLEIVFVDVHLPLEKIKPWPAKSGTENFSMALFRFGWWTSCVVWLVPCLCLQPFFQQWNVNIMHSKNSQCQLLINGLWVVRVLPALFTFGSPDMNFASYLPLHHSCTSFFISCTVDFGISKRWAVSLMLELPVFACVSLLWNLHKHR